MMDHLRLAPLAILAACLFFVEVPHAQSTTAWCASQAETKRITGKSRVEFMRKCEKDASGGTASAACQRSADGKGLIGAARAAELKRCLASSRPD